MNHHYRHFHMHEVQCPALTFHAVETPDDTLIISWSICSEHDNFSREVGRNVADNHLEHNIYLEGKRDYSVPLKQDIYNVLIEGSFPEKAKRGPKRNPEDFRKKAIQAMESFHITEAMLSEFKEASSDKKSLYWDRILPFVFKSKLVQRFFWGN